MEKTARVRSILAVTILVSALAPPLAASAATFTWTGAVSDSWTNKDNWDYVANTGGEGAGYPDGLGDQASFFELSNTVRFVTIPADTTIRVGVIAFGGGGQVIISRGNEHSRIILDNGILHSQIFRIQATPASTGADVVGVPVFLVGDVDIQVSANESFAFDDIEDDGLARSINKFGPGELILQTKTNYGGSLNAADGLVRVPNYSSSVLGHLVVGNDSATGAEVRIDRANAIADGANVTVKSDGALVMRGSERLANLSITRGHVAVMDIGATTLRLGHLLMSNNAKLVGEGAVDFAIDGQVTVTGSATIDPGAGVTPRLNLGASSRTFLVNPLQNVPGTLAIKIPVVGTGSGGLVKDGSGTLVFSGTGANTYPGETKVLSGSLVLDRNSVTIPGDLRIGFGAGASVTSARSGAIADASNVVVGANGEFRVDGVQEVIGNLTATPGGQVTIGTHNTTHLSVADLTVQGTDLQFSQNSTLTLRGNMFATSVGMVSGRLIGLGSLALTSGQHNVTVDDGPGDEDLSMGVPITGADAVLAFVGQGTSYVGADNTYAGPTAIAQGTLLVFGQQPANDMIVFGGTFGGGGRVGDVSVGPGTLAPMHHLQTGKVVLAPESGFASSWPR